MLSSAQQGLEAREPESLPAKGTSMRFGRWKRSINHSMVLLAAACSCVGFSGEKILEQPLGIFSALVLEVPEVSVSL